MQAFHYHNHALYIENIPLKDIADAFGTPCYVYSRAVLEKNWQAFDKAFGQIPHRICYAVKANSNIAILNLFARHQSGFDIVSSGELERVLAAGGDPQKIVFSGVGKTSSEIKRALDVGIDCFDIESEAELDRLHAIAKERQMIANIALRVNPNIDAKTHPYIATGLHENKFGIEIATVLALCQKLQTLPHLRLTGLACHIGSQLTELAPFMEAMECMLELVKKLAQQKITLQHINMGGGLGIRYSDETPPSIEEYINAILKKFASLSLTLHIEPGRAIVADAGILLTRVEYLKHTPYKNFAIVDAGMNDLMRPALYDAHHAIMPLQQPAHPPEIHYDIVGPVCESADFLGKHRALAIKPGDLLAVCSAGAYGFSMCSSYNSRPRLAEVLVDGDKMHLIRERETVQHLFALEKLI